MQTSKEEKNRKMDITMKGLRTDFACPTKLLVNLKEEKWFIHTSYFQP